MSTIKAIFCDIHGVLFEQDERFSVKYSSKFNIPIEILNDYLDNDFDLCLTGKADLKEKLPEFFKSWKWEGSVDELLDFWFGKETPPHKEFISYINSLHDSGCFIFLATQNEKYHSEKLIERLEPLLHYNYAIPTYKVGFKKSHPEYFTTCLKQYNLKPEEVLFIDNKTKPIDVAKSLGIHTMLFENETQAIADMKGILEEG